MFEENYKPIGNFIRVVNERNNDFKVKQLIGLSIDKCYIPSVANVIGTDLSKYKIIKKNQFACSLMQVSRDAKIPIACMTQYDEAIMSPAYVIFEIVDTSVLLPEYLNLWFMRPEFDREASFLVVGGVRGSLAWEDFCRMKLPVVSIEKQKSIVKSFKIITDRIELKRKINENLAETAQTIFKHTFIEPTQDGFPSTWTKVPLFQVADLGAGGDRPDVFSNIKTPECSIPIFSNGIESEGLYGYTDKAKVYSESVTISARGTVGYVFLRQEPFVPIVRLIYITPKNNQVTAKYLYFALRYAEMNSTGTSQQQITVPDFKNTPITVPDENTMILFMRQIEPLFDEVNRNKDEIVSLQSLQTVILQTISSR